MNRISAADYTNYCFEHHLIYQPLNKSAGVEGVTRTKATLATYAADGTSVTVQHQHDQWRHTTCMQAAASTAARG